MNNEQSDNSVQLSVVIPVYNEQDNIRDLHRELVMTLGAMHKTYEIVIVDDCSSDATYEVARSLIPAKVVRFRFHSGQSSAFDAGIKIARGRYVVTMDGDGQNDPRDIPALLAALEGQDVDFVCGWRHQRKDILLKRFVSHGALMMRRFFVKDNVHDAGCSLRIYKRICFEGLHLYGETHRMIPAILKWRGFTLAEIKVNHRPRSHGKTKYTWKRTIIGFLDMLYIWFWRKYAFRPLYLFGGIGLLLGILGSGLLAFLCILRFFYAYPLSDKIWPLVGFFFVMTGLLFFVMGILAVNIVDLKNEKYYFIKDIVDNQGDQAI